MARKSPTLLLALFLSWSLFSSAWGLGFGCFSFAVLCFLAPVGIARSGKWFGAEGCDDLATRVWLFTLGAVFATPLLPSLVGVDGFYLPSALLHSSLIYFAFNGEMRFAKGNTSKRVQAARVLLFGWGAWTLGSMLRGYFAYLPVGAPEWTPGLLTANSLGFGDMTSASHPFVAGILRFEMILFAWMGLELTLLDRSGAKGAVGSMGSRIARTMAWAIAIGFLIGAFEFAFSSSWRGDASIFARLEAGFGRNYRPLLDHNALGTAVILVLPMVICLAAVRVAKRLGLSLKTSAASALAPSSSTGLFSIVAPLAAIAGAGMLLTSRSKSALAGFALAILVLGSLLALRAGGKIRRLYLACLAFGVLAVVGFNLAPDSYVDGISSSRYGHDLVRVLRFDAAAEYIQDNRSIVWGNAAAVGSEHPFVGVGIGRLPLLMAEHHDAAAEGWFNPLHENAHSQYLQILAEQGRFGLAFFLAIIGLGLAGAWRGKGASIKGESSIWRSAGVAGLAAVALNLTAGHALLMPSVAVLFAGILGWLLAGPRQVEVQGLSTYEHSWPALSSTLCFGLAVIPLWLPGGRRPLPLVDMTAGCYPWEFQKDQSPDRARAISADARWFQIWGQGDVMKIPVRDVRDSYFEGTQRLTLRVSVFGSEKSAVVSEHSLPHRNFVEMSLRPEQQVNPVTYLRVEAPTGVQEGDIVELHLTASDSFNGSRLFSLDYRQVAARIWPPFFQ